jgi:hypothetical protein
MRGDHLRARPVEKYFYPRRQIVIGPTSLLVTFGAGRAVVSPYCSTIRVCGAVRIDGRTGGTICHLFAIYGQ